MKEIGILDAIRFDIFTRTRKGRRTIIVHDGLILLSYETISGWYLIPGGGPENGERPADCCVREVEEETSVIVRPLHQFLMLCEYYEEYRYISCYFICEDISHRQMHLTEAEVRRGLKPQWISLHEAVGLFSLHQSCATESEEKRGSYLRKYTAIAGVSPDWMKNK